MPPLAVVSTQALWLLDDTNAVNDENEPKVDYIGVTAKQIPCAETEDELLRTNLQVTPKASTRLKLLVLPTSRHVGTST